MPVLRPPLPGMTRGPVGPVPIEPLSTGPVSIGLPPVEPLLIEPGPMPTARLPLPAHWRLLRLPQAPALPPRCWRPGWLPPALPLPPGWNPAGGVPGCSTDAASPKRAH